jgi:hypothetical protein
MGGAGVFYEPHMLESIKRLEATRGERMGQQFPRLTADEKAALLKGYHPDYKAGTMRELAVGPNAGDRVPHELADLLEGQGRIDPDTVDLGHADFDVDILVVGGGGAGTSAALLAYQRGATVLLTTKLRLGDANTMMAQGGIQAADKPNDSPAIHYLDVMGGGGFENIPELVRALTKDAPSAMKWLEDLGAMFDKEPDGTMVSIHGGGTSRRRMHSARDYSGAEIMRTLRDEFRNRRSSTSNSRPRSSWSSTRKGSAPGRSSTTWRRGNTVWSAPRWWSWRREAWEGSTSSGSPAPTITGPRRTAW